MSRLIERELTNFGKSIRELKVTFLDRPSISLQRAGVLTPVDSQNISRMSYVEKVTASMKESGRIGLVDRLGLTFHILHSGKKEDKNQVQQIVKEDLSTAINLDIKKLRDDIALTKFAMHLCWILGKGPYEVIKDLDNHGQSAQTLIEHWMRERADREEGFYNP